MHEVARGDLVVIKIIVVGALGRMGRYVVECAAKDADTEIVSLVDRNAGGQESVVSDISQADSSADCIIDFSHHSAESEICKFARNNKISVVFATTGYTPEEEADIAECSKVVPIFKSANMSLGVALACQLAKTAAKKMADADCEIVETHHNKKLDSPSGTALMLANSVKDSRGVGNILTGRSGMQPRESDDITISCVRRGNVVGEHTVIFDDGLECIEIKHTAGDRSLFANGALRAAKFLASKQSGLYNMEDLVCE